MATATPYAQTALDYEDKGWTPLPLPLGAKTPPPAGTTGAGGREVSYSDVLAWTEEPSSGNIALRMPKGVIGIDVDAYKPNAAATMNHLISLAPMPPTVRSSAREDGASGIYFYRVPEEVSGLLRDPRGVDGGPSDVEIIRWNHRYAVVSPSQHPTAGQYRWWLDATTEGRAPRVDELPWLPQEWITALTPVAAPAAPVATYTGPVGVRTPYEQRAIDENIAVLQRMAQGATVDGAGYSGEPWNNTTTRVAFRLFDFVRAEWSPMTEAEARQILMAYAPRDRHFTDATVSQIADQASKGSGVATPPSKVDDSGLFASASAPQAPVYGSPEPVSTDRFAGLYLSARGLREMEPPAYLVHELIPESSIGYITGRDGTRKSFLALDMALSIVTGRAFHGSAVLPRSQTVLYVAAEGASSFGKRLEAWEAANRRLTPEEESRFLVRSAAVSLFQPKIEEWTEFAGRVAQMQPDLVIIDTLRRSSGAADQNSAGDMGQVTDTLEMLKRATGGGSVLVVAHTGKSDDDARGSSAIEDDADFVIHVKDRKGLEPFEASVKKMKDGPEGKVLEFGVKVFGESLAFVDAVDRSETVETVSMIQLRIRSVLIESVALDPLTTTQVIALVNADHHEDKGNIRSSVHRRLNAMVAAGEVEVVSKVGQTKRFRLAKGYEEMPLATGD